MPAAAGAFEPTARMMASCRATLRCDASPAERNAYEGTTARAYAPAEPVAVRSHATGAENDGTSRGGELLPTKSSGPEVPANLRYHEPDCSDTHPRHHIRCANIDGKFSIQQRSANATEEHHPASPQRHRFGEHVTRDTLSCTPSISDTPPRVNNAAQTIQPHPPQ